MKNTEDISKIAVVYARYSSHGQTEQSIEGQIAAAKTYAEKKGYTIIHEYCDRAKTGTNDNREAFQQMLSDTAKHSFGVIIVWKVDRFGRNREEITFNKYRCKKHGVRVEYVAENISEGPEGIILESVLEGMAEYFSVQLSQNVRRGLQEAAKKHRPLGGKVPLGFRVGSDKGYEIDPDNAPVIRMIFEQYTAGSSITEIITDLNAKGYRTQNGREFTKCSLPRILQNPRYCGTYVYKDLSGNVVMDENAIPAIIDKELFMKAQEMSAVHKRMPARQWNYSDYLLTGKLFCGLCGAPMIGESGFGKAKVKYSYYMCSNHRHKKQECEKKTVRQDWIDGLVLEQAHHLLDDPDLLNSIVDAVWKYYQETDTSQAEMNALQSQLSEVQRSIKNLLSAVEEGMPYKLAQPRISELQGQQAALQKTISEQQIVDGIRLTRDYIQFFLEKFRDYDLKDVDFGRKLVSTFINAVYLYDDQMTIAFNYTQSGSNATITLEDLEDKKSSYSEVFDCNCKSRG